ncbi:hypothetical protein BH23BAC1_BH23BAC1_30030 [soil metagenome]
MIKSTINLWPLYKNFLLIIIFIFFNSCTSPNNKAQDIIDQTISEYGGSSYENVQIDFDFRDRHYTAIQENGRFTYSREFQDSLGQKVVDVLDNNGFSRSINGQKVNVDEGWQERYSESINGVIYFALLPSPLNDPAVIKNYLGEVNVKGEPYHKIEVTFREEGGGKEFRDTFIYWIHQENSTMDYFAYDFETDGGGSRFREAKNARREGGIVFQDYYNYKPAVDGVPLAKYDSLLMEGKLEKLSEINLERVQVRPL